ncbi:MAG TPA: patatin-like phospholipase family protein, partial [Pyrinomonadaceae bacterium]
MSISSNRTADATPRLPYQKLEAFCNRQHIYPLYRVLEDEYRHQYGDLPDSYRQAKETLDAEIKEQLKQEIKRGLERAAEAEEHQRQRQDLPSQEGAPEVSEAELERRVMEDIEKSYEIAGGSRPTRYVVLVNEKFTAELYRHIHDLPEKRTALCFSGGGIRSASFGLGIVQGLARYGMLGSFDYLSTVSGGGYLGGWLSAWIHRSRLSSVINALKNEPEKNKLQPEPEPIRHLRSYSNYLNPQLGFLSADTWTLVAIVVRNLLLNWLVLIPVILAALMLPRIVVAVVQTNAATGARVLAWEFWLGTFFGLVAIVYMGVARPSASRPQKTGKQRLSQQNRFLIFCLLPLSLSAVLLTSWWAWRHTAGGRLFEGAWPEFLLYGVALHFTGYILYTLILIFKDFKFWRERGQRNRRLLLGEPVAVILVGLLWGVLAWFAANRVFPAPASASPAPPLTELYACFAAPLFVLIFLLAVIIFVGAASNITDDDDREWWARFGAWALIVSVLWGVLSALVIFGPFGLMWVGERSQLILAALSALGGGSGLLTILGGKSAKTSSHKGEEGQKSGGLADYATALAAPLFALTLLVVLSLATSFLIRQLSPALFVWHDPDGKTVFSTVGVMNTVHYAPL